MPSSRTPPGEKQSGERCWISVYLNWQHCTSGCAIGEGESPWKVGFKRSIQAAYSSLLRQPWYSMKGRSIHWQSSLISHQTSPAKNDTRMEMNKFYCCKEVLPNNYWSHNLNGLCHFWLLSFSQLNVIHCAHLRLKGQQLVSTFLADVFEELPQRD